MINPPSAGPATSLTWNITWLRAIADAMRSLGTRFGIAAARAGESNAENADARAAATYRNHSGGEPAIAPPSRRSDATSDPNWLRMSRRRRSIESAIAPPTSENTMSGPTCTRPISPTASVEPVSS